MKKNPAKQKPVSKKNCKMKKSKFDYSLIIRPDGSIEVENGCGKIIKNKGRKTTPPIKKIVNTRTLSIVEAEGSRWIFVDPPGIWIPIAH